MPFGGDQISIVTGAGRLVFVLLITVIVLCFYKFNLQINRLISRPLATLGVATYGIYLLHPVVSMFGHFVLTKAHLDNPYLMSSLVVFLSVAVAILSYRLFEEKMITLGKRITTSGAPKDREVQFTNG